MCVLIGHFEELWQNLNMNQNYEPNKDYEQELIKAQKKILKERGLDADESLEQKSYELFNDVFGEPKTSLGRYFRKEWIYIIGGLLIFWLFFK